MKTTKKLIVGILIPMLLMAATSCSSESDEMNPDLEPKSASTIAEVVASGDAFEDFPPNTTETEVPNSETTQNEPYDRRDSTNLNVTIQQRWICTEKEVDITGGTHTFPLYNPNASIIWPGNLLQGKTLGDATPRDIVVKRAAGTITYDLVNGNETATRSVDVIDQGSVQQAMNDIIAGSGDAPARFTLDVVAINSKEQLALEMGLNVSSFNTKVSSDFNYNSSSNVSSVLVKLTQQYYTMSYVKPTSLDEVFDPSVTSEQLATFIQPDNPATFISSVTYGRIFYMLYESSASAQDMEATLRGSYNAVAGEASAEISINKLREYNNLRVKVIAYGGDSEGTLEAVGSVFAGDEAVDNLKDIVDRLAFAGNIETGLPLSYVVNSLEDPSQVVSTNLATSYTVKNCELKGVLPPGLYSDLVDVFDDGIGALLNISGSNVILFNKAGDSYAWYNGDAQMVFNDGENPIIFNLKDENAPLGKLDIEDVGAAVDYSANVVYIFSGDGSKCQIATVDPSKISGSGAPNQSVVIYSDNDDAVDTVDDDVDETKIFLVNKIFGDEGILKLSNGIGAAVNTAYPTMAYFDRDNTVYQRYRSSTPNLGWDSTLFPAAGWFSRTEVPENTLTLFEQVGAATKFSLGGGSTRYLFVNEAGDEIMQWFSVEGTGDTFEGPWVIN